MGEVEIFIDEEGTLKVVQRYDLRVVLRRVRPKGVECHRVVRRLNCSSLCDTDEAKFSRVLRLFFVITVGWTLISLVIYGILTAHPDYPGPLIRSPTSYQTWLSGPVPTGQTGIVVLAVFAAVLTVGVLMKMVPRTGGARRQAVPAVSSLVLQV